MIDSIYVAWRYLTFNWGRSLTLIACVTLIAVLPLSLELLLDESERQLLARAESTPLVVGAKGRHRGIVSEHLPHQERARCGHPGGGDGNCPRLDPGIRLAVSSAPR